VVAGAPLVDAAERTCPYTKAIRGNVPFSTKLNAETKSDPRIMEA
jgi:hypothetical protein